MKAARDMPSRGWVGSATPRPLCAQERDPVTILQEAVWAEAGLDGCGRFRPQWVSNFWPPSL